MKKNTDKVIAHLPVDSATYLLNEKRAAISDIEKRHQVGVIVIPSKHLETPAYEIQRVRSTGAEEEGERKPSYQMLRPAESELSRFSREGASISAEPAVKEFLPSQPAPMTAAGKQAAGGLIKRFWSILTGGKPEEEAETGKERPQPILSPVAQHRPHRIADFKPRAHPMGGEMLEARETESRASLSEKQEFGNGDRRARDQSRRGGSRRRRSRRGEPGLARNGQQTPSRDAVQEKTEDASLAMAENRTPGYRAKDEEAAQAITSAPAAYNEAPSLTEAAREQAKKPEFSALYLPKPAAPEESRIERETRHAAGVPGTESSEFEPSSDFKEEAEAEDSGFEDSSLHKSPRRSLAKRRGRGRRDKRFAAKRVEAGEGQNDTFHEGGGEAGEMSSTANGDRSAEEHRPAEDNSGAAGGAVADKPGTENGTS